MPVFKAGVVGPIPLGDGRVVAGDKTFKLTVASPHDQDLVDRGVIVLAEDSSAAPKAKADTTTTVSAADKPKGT